MARRSPLDGDGVVGASLDKPSNCLSIGEVGCSEPLDLTQFEKASRTSKAEECGRMSRLLWARPVYRIRSCGLLFVRCLIVAKFHHGVVPRNPPTCYLLSPFWAAAVLSPMQPWTTPGEVVWLTERFPQWHKARRSGLQNWFTTTTNEFMTAFPDRKSMGFGKMNSVRAFSPQVMRPD